MKTLKEACETGEFILTAELLPPKGSDISPFQERAKRLLGKVHAVNVTDNPGAVMRAGALAMSKVLLDLGHDPIYQMTARDRNRLAIQSDLLGAHILGVRNVLCLRGDDVTVGDQKESRPVFDLDSVQMLRVVTGLNQGKDMAGNLLNGTTSFFPGGAVAPEGAPLDSVLANFSEKAAAGAKFFQTQGVFHPEPFERFIERARKWDVKIIAGVILLRSAKRARFMAENIPGVRPPERLIRALERAGEEGAPEVGLEFVLQTLSAIRKLCDGAHIMAIGAEDQIPVILEKAGLASAGRSHG